MKKSSLRSGLAVLFACGLALGVSACGSADKGQSDKGGESAAAEGPAACEAVTADLETARQAVADALEDDPSWSQVMLAPDVTEPTEKYGLLVMPFVKTDAADRVQGTVDVKDGKYTIEADTMDGVTCTIDQDSKITEAE